MPLPASQIHRTMQTATDASFPNGSINAGKLTLVFRIRQHTDGTVLKEHRMILAPATMVQETEARTSLYYTQGGMVADTPMEHAIGATHFQITGHTGFHGVQSEGTLAVADRVTTPVTFEAFTRTVQSVVTTFTSGGPAPRHFLLIDGAAALKDLQDTVFAYFFPQGQTETRVVTRPADLQLEFLNLTAPTSSEDRTGRVGHIIHPHRNLISIRQDATKPFLYFYHLQFAAIGSTSQDLPDRFVEQYTAPRSGLKATLDKLTRVVTALTNGINTISDAFTQLVIQNVTGPLSTFLEETTRLGDAVGHFLDGTAAKLRFPLYAQRTVLHALDAPAHSVTTLAQAAKDLGVFLYEASAAKTISTLVAGESLADGINDLLTLRLNRERPVSLALGTQTSGVAIAAAIQSQVRATAPEHAANASAYRDFTATFANGQYTLISGTALSDSASVEVVVNPDPLLTPTDASAVLGLGLANGGQEHAGSAYPSAALALLRGVEQACAHLQGFPDYFADQLDAQDAALAALLPAGIMRPQIRGDQYLRQTRITPGDTIQGIANRVGVPWETLALVNRLTYPFIIEEPTTLMQGRVSSAEAWSIVDVTRMWPVDAYQGQRVDIVAGMGAGQSRRILRNTPTTLVLETAWTVTPSDISDYAIRTATNPVQRTGAVSSATVRTVTDSSLSLVPGSQRGLTLVVTSGSTAGDRRGVVANDAHTYSLDRPWEVAPTAGSLYLLLGPAPATFRQKVVGDWLGVPQPSAQTRLPIRTRLHDVSAITGQQRSVEERLFGRDLLLDLETRALVWDAALGDARTIAELPNLKQALVHYINLPLAELEYAPGLGSYVQETIGLSATLPLQIELLASVERTIRQDRRVARMTNAQLVGSGGTVLIAFGAQAINGSTIERIAIR
jgi:hypothetical protein